MIDALTISPTMDLGALAERMGSEASQADALRMLGLLLSTPFKTTAEIPEAEWLSMVATVSGPSFTVIFDNGGGTTLKFPGWAHYYEAGREADAAADLRSYLACGGNASDWDGDNEAAGALEPDADEIRNGCYRVATSVEGLNALREWGRNASAFWAAFNA